MKPSQLLAMIYGTEDATIANVARQKEPSGNTQHSQYDKKAAGISLNFLHVYSFAVSIRIVEINTTGL